MSQSRVYKIEGILTIPATKFEYAVFSNKTSAIELISLTDIFMDIYKNSPSSNVKISVDVKDIDIDDYCEVFKGSGELFLDKSQGVWDWFVGKKDLGMILFNMVGRRCLIEIEDLDYGKYVKEEEEI